MLPVQVAPAYSAPHMLTVNVWPAAADTPHMASRVVSLFVFHARNGPQNPADVGASVGSAEGAGVGAVGCAVGGGVLSPAAIVGLAVGSADGMAEGTAVVGRSVGTPLGLSVVESGVGAAEGAGDEPGVGMADGLQLGGAVGGIEGCPGPVVGTAVGAADGAEGAGVGVYVTSCTPAPATTAVPVQPLIWTQPSSIRYVCVGVPAGTVYCTCAHELAPEMHCAGGRAPVPVSSYTTSTPAVE